MEAFTVKLDGSGRILLPAKVRKQLKLQKGSELIARLKKEQLVLQTRVAGSSGSAGIFLPVSPEGGKLLSDELIEDRRKEARRELDD